MTLHPGGDATSSRAKRGISTALALLFSIALSSSAHAGSRFAERAFGTSDGLSQSGIEAIVQDGDGYLWIATQDGLNRFDGVHFSQWFVDEGLPSNVVDTVFVDSRGRVWVGTEAGLAVIERGDGARRARAIAMPATFHGGRIGAIVESGGAIYAQALEDLVRVGDDLRADVVARGGAPPVTSLAVARDGAVLVGTRAGLFRATPSGPFARVHPEIAALASLHVWAMQVAPDGDVWLAGEDGGLFVLDPAGGFRAIGEPERFGAKHVSALALDGDALLVSTYDDGLYRIEGGVATQLAAAGHRIAAALVDAERTIWVADFTDGKLLRLEAAKFATLTEKDGLPTNQVYGIHPAKDGVAWLATSNGLAKVDPTQLAVVPQKAPIGAGLELTGIAESSDGTVCAGTLKHGAICLDDGGSARSAGRSTPEEQTQITMKDGLPGETVDDLVFDREGRLWLATSKGIAIVDQGKVVRTLGAADGLLEVRLFTIYADHAGTIWVGYSSRSGVSAWRGDHFEHLGEKDGLPRGGVTSIFEDRAGRLWVTTDGGIARREPNGRFRTWAKKDGVPSDEVYVALEDDDGALWLSTDDGVAKLADDRIVATYTTDDGLAANEGQSRGGAKDARGRLWIASTGGVTIIDPRHIPTNDVPPRVAIESVDRRDNNVRFVFTATSFREPRAMRFAYRLDGFDRDWTEMPAPVVLRAASYTNLPPGNYAFEVKATNNDGVWSREPAVTRFHVDAPWWRTPWAYALGAASLVLLGYGVTQLRLRGLRTRAGELERQVTLRTRELLEKNLILDAQLARTNELNEQLVASQQRADRIFSALTEALPGTVLDGRYRLDERVGSGGFGVVFKATHLDLKRHVAVKVFRPQPGNDSAEAVERFRREAISACRVQHPNAVAVYDSGISSDGILYLVMELLDGESLAAVLARTPRLPVRRAIEIALEVTRALEAAHAQGIVHRDVKPENVVLHHGPEGEVVKVVDFGVARLLDAEQLTRDVQLTQSDAIIGTPSYMAPERLTGGPYDGRSDVYSVGVLLYQCLSGHLPIESDDPALVARIMRQINEDARPIRDHVSALPESIATIVMRAIHRLPDLRPDAHELAFALEEALGDRRLWTSDRTEAIDA